MVNEVTGFLDAARVWRDPKRYEAALWDPSAIRAYYGKELTPPYVPEGLSASPGNGTAQAILRKEDGAVVEDTVWLGFYHAYYEDGSPQLTEGMPPAKGFPSPHRGLAFWGTASISCRKTSGQPPP